MIQKLVGRRTQILGLLYAVVSLVKDLLGQQVSGDTFNNVALGVGVYTAAEKMDRKKGE